MHSDTSKKVVYIANRSASPAFLLTLLFIALKLMGYIAWPWYWVVAPMWIPFAVAWGFVAGVMMVMGLAGLAAAIIALWLDRK